MHPVRHLLVVIGLVLLVPATTSAAAFGSAAGPSHVQASLVAEDSSVQPGHDVVVALRLVHDSEWHTYWVNPGTGLPTTLAWDLPPGWKAGPILWPTPAIIRDHTDTIVGQGYEGDMLLPVVLTAPPDLATGTRVTLKARTEWLMCSATCIPGNAELSLDLPVAASAPQPDPVFGAKIRATLASLPRTDSGWQAEATRSGKTITLHVWPTNGTPSHTPEALWFFSEDGVVAYEQPQTVKTDTKGQYYLTLPVATEAPANARRLVGVLAAKNGWRTDGTLPGLRIDTALRGGGDSGPAATNASAGTPANGQGLPGTLLLAFVGGLILNLMPCVFPVLGIKILGFVNQAGHERGRVVAHGLTFTLGVLVSFWALAGVLAALRASGEQLGWGFQLQSPAFVYALAVLMLVFGMNMSGVFEFGLRATAIGSGLQAKSGYSGSFFSGVLATVVATPCSAPFLAPALGAALAVSTAQSFAIFTSIALGLALPYLLLSLFPQAVKILPRPGAWMETFKGVMAFPLYATTAYLAWVLAAQTSEEGFRAILFSFVLIAMAVWLYGRWHAPTASVARARLGIAALLVVGALGLWAGWPRASAQPSATGATPSGIAWETWSPEAVAKLRSEGRIVYVDFTARWCATCQANKRLVFHDDAVLKYFAEHNVAALRADWTNRDPRITTELAAYGRSAVPFNVIWVPGRKDPIILSELLTAGTVLDALRNTPPGSS